jgi:hypothetical protein
MLMMLKSSSCNIIAASSDAQADSAVLAVVHSNAVLLLVW